MIKVVCSFSRFHPASKLTRADTPISAMTFPKDAAYIVRTVDFQPDLENEVSPHVIFDVSWDIL